MLGFFLYVSLYTLLKGENMFSMYSKRSLRSLFVAFSLCMVSMDFSYGEIKDINTLTLHEAAQNGDLKAMKELIDKGANVKAINKYGQTALHLAALYGKLEVVKYLIEEQNVNVNEWC
jgi:hypothetical protein